MNTPRAFWSAALLALSLGCHSLGCGDRSAPAASQSAASQSAATPQAAPSASVAPAASGTAPATTASGSSEPAASATPPPRDKAAYQAILTAITPDPAPAQITRNTHYLTSNEESPQLWTSRKQALGGVQVGVGAEQNLLIAGWFRPEVLVCMDFDEWVVALNFVHGLLLEKSETPKQYEQAWKPGNTMVVTQWIKEKWPDPAAHALRLKAYVAGKLNVFEKLVALRTKHDKIGIKSYVNDQDTFDYVKRLWVDGRAHAVLGNLTETRAMRSISEAARKLGLPIRVLYLSNAEYYFPFSTGGYKENILSLPFDAQGLVLHTHPVDQRNYHYVFESGQNFQAHLRAGKIDKFKDLFLTHARRVPSDLPEARWLNEITAEP